MTTEPRPLAKGEPHPASFEVQEFLQSLSYTEAQRWLDTFRINSDDGDKQRLAQVCADSLERLLEGLPLSDTELLGLGWVIKSAV